jgi:hypothetical protein
MNKVAVTDKEIEDALLAANGQPTVAAKALGIGYPSLFKRIRKNPDLGVIQKASRSRVFIELSHMTEFAVKTGFMQKRVLDDNGNMTDKVVLVELDERTRMDAAFKIMAMFKGDEDIVDKIELDVKGSVPVDAWLNRTTLEIGEAEEVLEEEDDTSTADL